MKKNYIHPVVTVNTLYTLEKLLSNSVTSARYGAWGNATSSHGNADWVNEGYKDQGSIIRINNDDGEISTQSKGRGSDWGSIW